MKFSNMDIQRKILALLLSAGLLSFFALAMVSFISMYQLSADAEESGRRMGEAAADFTEEFAIARAKKRVADISQEKAQLIEHDTRENIADAEYLALSAAMILSHPERNTPIALPEAGMAQTKTGEAYILYTPKLRQSGISPRGRNRADVEHRRRLCHHGALLQWLQRGHLSRLRGWLFHLP